MIRRTRFLVVALLLAGSWAYMFLHRDMEVPLDRPFLEFPAVHAAWRMIGQSTLSPGVLQVLRPTDYLNRRYMDAAGNRVDFYLSYFDGGRSTGGIHSPKNCLPGSGWMELSSQPTTVELNGRKLKLVKAVYGMGDTHDLMLYWFDVRGHSLTNEYSLKLMELLGSAIHRRRDESFVRIVVPIQGNPQQAYQTGLRFIEDFYPVIRNFLPS